VRYIVVELLVRGAGRPDCRRTQLPERTGEDSVHHRPVQGEERGAGKGDTAVAGDSGQSMEKRGRTETVEVGTCRA